MIVYLITNLVNGKRYVGQTRESLSLRWQRHVWKAHEGSENYKNSWTPERKKMIGAIHAGKKQSAEQVRKRVLARKKTLEALGRTH